MGRVIHVESVGKDRTRLTKAIVLALRELMRQSEPNEAAHDLAAFIVLALEEIDQGIDASVQAWEKRDYWVKADQFRRDWAWAGRLSKDMRKSLLAENWGGVAASAVQVAERLQKVEVPKTNRLGTPWVGAWGRLTAT